MNSLKEELRQLTIGNTGRCNGGYVRTGTVAALVDNLQKNEEKNETYSRSKTAPWIPPKPSKKTSEMPQVPLSKLVTDTREPLYSQPLQATAAGSAGPACSFLRKQTPYSEQTENSKSTLDNPAVLEHQLEALAYHKLQMEKKGLLSSRPTHPVQSIPNLSSASLGGHKLPSFFTDKPMKVQQSMRSDNLNKLYSNIQQSSPQIPNKQLANYTSQPFAEKEFEDDLPQPPSPVSSSYSELRRASNVFKKDSDICNRQTATTASIFNSNYVNHYVNNSKESKSKGCADYYGYGGLSQSSSTYDSIYEPINPRPPNDITLRTNLNNMYASYVNQSGNSLMPNSEHYTVYPSALQAAETVDYSKGLQVDGNVSQYHLTSIDAGEVESYGICNKCGERVLGENSGCTAMDQIYHISCFTCTECQVNLQGKPFYALEGKPFCEYDYLQTLEKCSVCLMPILERILRATGKPYHPQCFTCVVCGSSLDAIPFTVDATNQNYCIEDFHKKFAPRCCVCKDPIMPEPGQDETVRVVALDRSFHLECYKCEDCGLLLSSEADGRGCYPLDDHVLCKSCNAKRVQVLTDGMT